VTADNAASACARHMPVPSTNVTACSSRPDGRHGAQNPNGSPGITAATTRSSRPAHNQRMPWATDRPRSRRYGPEHQAERERHMRALRQAGSGICAERVCIMRSRVITPDMDLHLCHDPTGTVVIGLGHADCNRHEAAVRARRMQGRNSGRTLTAAKRGGQPRRSALRW
jgi:hypothetical protein